MTSAAPRPSEHGAPAGPIPPTPPAISVPTLQQGTAGQLCVAFYQEPTQPGPNSLAPRAAILANQLLGQYGLCPATRAPAAVAANPAVLAEQFWQTIHLPAPRPAVPPGFAVTGKPAYLVTDGTLTPAPWSEATPLGRLVVTARGSYVVSWGDGTSSGPFASEGLPFPDGTITHTYDDVGRMAVTVEEQWSAVWRLGRAGGVLQQLQTVGRIPALPVEQIQAVITH